MKTAHHRQPSAHFSAPTITVPKAEKGGSLFAEQAVDQWMRLLTSAADPDEVLRKAGMTRTRLRILSGDDEITTAMDTRKLALQAVPWRLEVPGGQPSTGKRLQRDTLPEPIRWVWDELDKISDKVLGACMEAVPYGYSVQEAVYKNDVTRGRVTWEQVTEKPFEWFVPKLDGTVLYKSSTNPQGMVVDSRKFFLTARLQSYRQPYGEALYSRAYWPWFFRSNGWRFWAKWMERMGTPLLIGKTAGDAGTVAKALAKAVQDSAIAVGQNDEIQVVGQTSGASHFEGFERACCSRIQKLILGQTLTTDSGGSAGVGSQALGNVHNEVRRDRRDADIRMVTPVVQRMIEVLWGLNGFPGLAPRFVMQDDTGLELERATRDAALATAGVANFTEGYLVRTYDFDPEDLVMPDPNAAAVVPPGPKPPAANQEDSPENDPATAAKPGPAQAAAALPKFTAKQQVIEDRMAEILKGLPQAIDPVLISDAIKAAASPQELVGTLAALLGDMDYGPFQRVLTGAVCIADMIGFAHAETLPAQA